MEGNCQSSSRSTYTSGFAWSQTILNLCIGGLSAFIHLSDELMLRWTVCRYFCQQQYLAEGTELGRMKSKNIQWNIASELSDFIPTVSKFNPDQRRGINALTKHSRQIIKDKNTPPSLAEASEGDLIGSFVVTVMGARNLPVKEISNSMNMGGPFGLVLPKLFVQVYFPSPCYNISNFCCHHY